MVSQIVTENWPALTLAAVLGVGGGTAARFLPPSSDRWTRSDARAARSEYEARMKVLKREIQVDLRELEIRLHSTRPGHPPHPTRRRIEGLEDAVTRLEADAGRSWRPVTDRFSEPEAGLSGVMPGGG